MKNESNFISTQKVEYQNSLNESLVLSLDIDNKSDTINGIKFSGNLLEKNLEATRFLEDQVRQINFSAISELKFPFSPNSLPWMLLLKSLRENLGIICLQKNCNHLCICYGVTKTEIKNIILDSKQEGISFAQLMEQTKAGTGCGKCFDSSLDLFIEENLNLFPDGVVKLQTIKGQFPEHKGMTYAEILLKIDQVLKKFLMNKNIDQYSVTIQSSDQYKIYLEDLQNIMDKSSKKELSQLVFRATGLLIFFQNRF